MRRDELYDSSSSDAGSGSRHVDAQEDAEVRAKLNERLASLLGLDLSASAPTFEHKESDRGEDVQEEEEEFEFRLFSTSSKTAAPAKVILAASDDEDAPQGEGGFTVPARPTSYYVAGDPTPEQRARYRWAAVAGEDIVLGARKRAWGLEKPWRVIRMTVPNKSLAGLPTTAAPGTRDHASEGGEQEAAVKRKRPGKKRRIATRIKAKAEKEKREAAEKYKMSKDEHVKEKKKRLNREKKLKRRAKEREKKLATKGEGGTQPASEAGASASESDDDSAA